MTTLKQKILERCKFDDGSTNFDDFDAWMEGQGKDASDLSIRYYLPDLRVAFIEGKGVQHAKNLSLVTELLELVERQNRAFTYFQEGTGFRTISRNDEPKRREIILSEMALELAKQVIADTTATLQRLGEG